MKLHNSFGLVKTFALLAAAIAGAAGLALSAETPSPASDAGSATNSALAAASIPASVFDVVAPVVKDPFYPLSTRSPVPVQVATNVAPQQINYKSFILNGMSTLPDGNGTLVIINGHSFAQGESYEITPLGSLTKVKVTVSQIKEYSAIIRVEGYSEGLEISLPETAR